MRAYSNQPCFLFLGVLRNFLFELPRQCFSKQALSVFYQEYQLAKDNVKIGLFAHCVDLCFYVGIGQSVCVPQADVDLHRSRL